MKEQPYIKAGTKNVKIPKGKEPASLTLEECVELAANAPERRGRFGRFGAKKKEEPKKVEKPKKVAKVKAVKVAAADGEKKPKAVKEPKVVKEKVVKEKKVVKNKDE